MSRRMMYFRTILSREEEELNKRKNREQERNASPGYFVELVKDDFSKCNLTYNEEMIIAGKVDDYRSLIRKHIKAAAFNELKTKQSSHSKVNDIVYENLEKQSYLISPIFTNNDIGILSNLRSHTTRGIRSNYKQLYKDDQNCPLKCTPPDTMPVRYTQEHLLSCKKLKQTKHTVVSEKIVINNIYGTVSQQKAVATLAKENLQERNKLLDSNPTSGCDHWTLAPPGAMQAQLDICNDNCSVSIGNKKIKKVFMEFSIKELCIRSH